jgi:transcription initiation factor TFIIB
MNETKCSDCSSRNLTLDDARGEKICDDCGLVVEEAIADLGAEWRVYSDGNDSGVRGGEKLTNLLHDKGLSTAIDWQNRDYSGKTITANRSQLYRMRKWQKRTRISNSRERNLAVALAELARLGSQMNLPQSHIEAAADIYRMANDKRLCRGRSIDAVVASSIYVACRVENMPRTLDEVARQSRTGRKEIGRTARMLQRELKLRVKVSSPTDYNARFCSMLQLPPDVQSKSQEILEQLIEYEHTNGRGPVGLCAAAIYIASKLIGNSRTQREVSETAGITEVTVRHRYKEILRLLKMEDEFAQSLQ